MPAGDVIKMLSIEKRRNQKSVREVAGLLLLNEGQSPEDLAAKSQYGLRTVRNALQVLTWNKEITRKLSKKDLRKILYFKKDVIPEAKNAPKDKCGHFKERKAVA